MFSPCVEYPSAPSNLHLQLITKGSLTLCLSWDVPRNQRKTFNDDSITSYSIFLNRDLLVKKVPVAELLHSEEEENRVSVELVREDFTQLGQVLVDHSSGECVMSVRSCEEYYTSEHSPVVVFPSSAVQELLPAIKLTSSLLVSGSLVQSVGRTKTGMVVMTNGVSGVRLEAGHGNAAGASEEDENETDDEDTPEEITEG